MGHLIAKHVQYPTGHDEPDSLPVESTVRSARGYAELPDVVLGVSCSIGDKSREAISPFEWNPGRQLIRSIRLYAKGARMSGAVGKALQKSAILSHRFWSAVAGSDIPINLGIGLGLLLPHPTGIVIHPNVRIGPNCLIFQQVTLGTRGSSGDVPSIGGHVDIGAGAKILGGVTIGCHARIGANAVVLSDVPAGALAVGIPATIRR